MKSGFRAHLEDEFAAADCYRPNKADWLDGRWSDMGFAEDDARRGETGVDHRAPEGSSGAASPASRRTSTPTRPSSACCERRREMVETGEGIDWSMGEHLAFGTLLNEGFPVRLSGQD